MEAYLVTYRKGFSQPCSHGADRVRKKPGKARRVPGAASVRLGPTTRTFFFDRQPQLDGSRCTRRSAMIIRDIPYIGWCRIIRAGFQTARGMVEREIEDHGDAVAVLPYDPQRKKLMLIRLMRAPVVWASGSGELVECPAGMID